MKASKFYSKEKYELISALDASKDISYTSIKEEEDQIELFFESSKDLDYNVFLEKYNERYGNIIKQYRESQKLLLLKSLYQSNNPNGEFRELTRKTLKTVYIASIVYIVSSIVAILFALNYFNQN